MESNQKMVTLAEGLSLLEDCGVRRRADATIDDLLFSTGGKLDDPIEFVHLLCLLGGTVERGSFQPVSDDLWHFDTECIYGSGDYVSIAERLRSLSKGALVITDLADDFRIEDGVAWLEFKFRYQKIRWDFEVKDDWVDATIFSRVVELFGKVDSASRFTYADLGGQDCLIGFATEEQRHALTQLTGLCFEPLS
jgi:hypothetical protein